MDLSLADFVLFLLLGSFGVVVFFSIVSRTLHQRAESRALSRRVICRLCLHAFEIRDAGKIVDCPHCGVTNERGASRRSG